jgi:hypothetical protein
VLIVHTSSLVVPWFNKISTCSPNANGLQEASNGRLISMFLEEEKKITT